MTNLRSALKKYLSMRKGLGYKYEQQARRLVSLVIQIFHSNLLFFFIRILITVDCYV